MEIKTVKVMLSAKEYLSLSKVFVKGDRIYSNTEEVFTVIEDFPKDKELLAMGNNWCRKVLKYDEIFINKSMVLLDDLKDTDVKFITELNLFENE